MRATLQNRALRGRSLIITVLLAFLLSPLIYPPGGTRASYVPTPPTPIVHTIGELPKPREMRMEILSMECKAPYQVLDNTCKLPPPPPPPPPAPKPVYVAPKPVYVAPRPIYAPLAADTYKSFIYSHESGNNPYAINSSSGACGLGQALPCSKMPCALGDYNCQDHFFTSYMLSRYGSWYNAYVFWIAHRWW